MKAKKTWQEKLKVVPKNRVVPIPPKWRKRFGRGKMLIPRGTEVDAIVRKIPKGKLMTHEQVRLRLAKLNRVDQACPLVTGIHMRIVAEAAEEARREGKKRITPYWRVIKTDGKLNPKYPGGTGRQARLLRAEGFSMQRGKVSDYEGYLVS